jgi:toxin YoeB
MASKRAGNGRARDARHGTGPPSPLSRRITQEHRLVYRVSGKPGAQVLEIAQCRYHY